MKDDNVLDEWEEKDQAELDKKSARKMVWRTRLSIGFTVIRTLLLIFLIYIVYMIPVSIYYDMSGKKAEFDRLITTLVETRYSGFEVHESHGTNAEINALLTQSTTLKLYRSVGEWDVVIGEVTAQKHLIGKIGFEFNFNEKYLNTQDKMFNFAIAPDLLGKDSASSNGKEGNPKLWAQFNKIGDGHVAQIHFSAKKGMTPREMMNLLNPYDLKVLQMPVYGGEIKEYDISHSRAGQFTFVNALLLRPQAKYDEKNRLSFSSYYLHHDSIGQSIDQFYKDIEWLIENGSYNGKDIDRKRLNYLRENGMKVYGATVTGPVREIEKLQSEELLHQFYLGGIEVWNWDEN
ncbi:anti sigma factor C-terminal domain-containing protein [Virgibacillus sp. JSM 102003]|uniref:anti sigma factor C-terminal domain-containing protein n=1 Tax=Virgibacillus sp. JSM 102003 TaxID=1562108 RepID=UPI0035C1E79E